jgi:Phe-tRNA synthetase beta subunit B1 domain
MYVVSRPRKVAIDMLWQTTEQVNDAMKRGLPAERPVRRWIVDLATDSLFIATENRDPSKQAIALSFDITLWTHICAFRYDLLCIEGISRALRIFLQKDIPPDYKLVFPSGGEKNLLAVTVSAEVSLRLLMHRSLVTCNRIDCPNPSLLRWCYFTQHKIYSTILCIFHRFTGQITSEFGTSSHPCRHWDARPRYVTPTFPFRSPIA